LVPLRRGRAISASGANWLTRGRAVVILAGVQKSPAAVLAIVAVLCAGCGARQTSTTAQPRLPSPPLPTAPSLHAHPQAVEPIAGAVARQNASPSAPASVSVGGDSTALAQPVSDAEIRHELAASGVAQHAGRATLTAAGLAVPPANAPAVIQQVITAGNQIAHLPYRFGGGHGTFVDSAYDCSGSLSYVFASAGLLTTTVDSGQLMSMGAPGPGKWITVFANSGHTFMYVAGLRFDTVALAEYGTRWSDRSANEPDLSSFVVRHPPGL
jgi:cell wall-associated NlpC family hydrolase